jgi:hypothetical protein
MVKRYNLTPQFGGPPAEGATDGERRIAGGPLYAVRDVLKLLEKVSLQCWTRKCQNDVRKLDLDQVGVASLVNDAIKNGKFNNSEWCVQDPTGPWAACDAYVLKRKEWNTYSYKELQCEYYVKFSIPKSGRLLLLISCHSPEDSR